MSECWRRGREAVSAHEEDEGETSTESVRFVVRAVLPPMSIGDFRTIQKATGERSGPMLRRLIDAEAKKIRAAAKQRVMHGATEIAGEWRD